MEFFKPYRVQTELEIPLATRAEILSVPEGDYKQLFASSRAWSGLFGSLLYSKLSSEHNPPVNMPDILNGYQEWCAEILNVIHEKSHQWHRALRDNGADFRALNRSNTFRQHSAFHDINRHHLDQWSLLFSDTSPEQIRLAALDSKFALACLGSHYAKQRDAEIKDQGEAAWFDEDKRVDRQSLEGFLHEVDAGIVLNDLAARPDHSWICIPAPEQFETHAFSAGQTPSANVDFIVFDPSSRGVIGIQVKSRVSERELESYDSKRVILIDGRIDLGNEAGKRTDRKSSSIQIVSWGGQIAIEHLASTSVKHPRYGRVILNGKTMSLKQFASRAAKGQTPQMRKSADRIAPRLLVKL